MTKHIPIAGANALSDTQRRSLRALVALMIPASAEYQVPGADDQAIFGDIVSSLGRDAGAVRQVLKHLEEMSAGPFADLPASQQEALAQQMRDDHPALASALVAVTTRCYYRDDRIMQALGMQPRPPFPQGFDVEQGDWSLLEPVRARRKIYRDAP
ncbi:hypothetical protein [Lacisediminimonas profundi]|uniref:hypothetical protein n=1 Tax=Lacisediminimonas profundi TaxID=2603856 RepID=UPI00124BC5A1|nr:hypothetical protein [Lacisediminimonas profundi]